MESRSDLHRTTTRRPCGLVRAACQVDLVGWVAYARPGRLRRGRCAGQRLGLPPHSVWLTGVEVGGFLQAGAETTADRGPALAIAIISDQPVDLGRTVELVLDVGLI